MKIKFEILTLQCLRSREIIDLTHHISFFHGKVSSGKSSIARLIDFCLGGELERTPAITRELISVTLSANIGEYKVLLERDAVGSNQIQVTWINNLLESAMVSAPIVAGEKPIWEDYIYNLSDLIFYLLNINPLKVRSNKQQEDSPLVRLSIRDFMRFSYLEQDHLDSSFFKLEDPFRGKKSRDVLRYVIGYYTQKLNDLEIELAKAREERATKKSTAIELRNFLKKFGYESITDIENEIKTTQKKLDDIIKEKVKIEGGYIKETHTADDTRLIIKSTITKIEEGEDALKNLTERIEEQVSLKAELVSSKFKLARTESVINILAGVKFDNCPSCGVNIEKKQTPKDCCNLCGSDYKDQKDTNSTQHAEIMRLDLDSRIKDIETSIEIHKTAYARQIKLNKKLFDVKVNLDKKLYEELKNYESVFLSSYREVDRKVATYKERLKSQNRLKEMPQEIALLEASADELLGKEQGYKRAIDIEKLTLTKADAYITELEETFLHTLLVVGLPGIDIDDTVNINRRTWDVNVFPEGEEYLKWNFYNAGSGGKKTLYNVCFILSLHLVASKNNLPLPSFLIIDTPMKNIDKEVNADLFKNFYDYLYGLAKDSLKDIQFIILDNSFVTPMDKDLDFYSRYMTPDDPNNPPLISYYSGA